MGVHRRHGQSVVYDCLLIIAICGQLPMSLQISTKLYYFMLLLKSFDLHVSSVIDNNNDTGTTTSVLMVISR